VTEHYFARIAYSRRHGVDRNSDVEKFRIQFANNKWTMLQVIDAYLLSIGDILDFN
jgi:hypothetical protein